MSWAAIHRPMLEITGNYHIAPNQETRPTLLAWPHQMYSVSIQLSWFSERGVDSILAIWFSTLSLPCLHRMDVGWQCMVDAGLFLSILIWSILMLTSHKSLQAWPYSGWYFRPIKLIFQSWQAITLCIHYWSALPTLRWKLGSSHLPNLSSFLCFFQFQSLFTRIAG